MSAEIAEMQASMDGYKIQLEQIALALQSDPDNEDLKSMETDINQLISEYQTILDDLTAAAAPPPKQPTPPPAEKPKWSIENHPAYKDGSRKPPPPAAPEEPVPAKQRRFEVNERVLAKWVTGDKGFYSARVTSVTGSKADPVYYVKFEKYDNIESVRGNDIRAFSSESKKRKADGSSVAAPSQVKPGVISAAAHIDPTLATAAKQEPAKVADGAERVIKAPKKIKAKKELEENKNKWQAFNAGKFKKGKKKESMFRLGDSATARVGFTGSGQAMRKDAKRTRHVHQVMDDNEAD